ncbi:DeoR/GlpR family DNA-binding transcription regulator [Brachybacterium huguangmaarense]
MTITPLYAQQRRRRILDALETTGRVAVADLAEAFEVTTETVRRDLDDLAGRDLLVRVHGGAVARRTAVLEPDLTERSGTNTEAKRRIADAAAAFLPRDPSASVLLDAGTTCALLAPRLAGRRGAVITHSVDVVRALSALPDALDGALAIHMLPGRVRPRTGAVVGSPTVAALGALTPDVAFLGCNGMTRDGFTTPDPEEAAVKAAIVRRAALRVVLADSSKADVTHLVRYAEVEEIDVLVTDADLPPALSRSLTDSGIEVVTA